MSNNVPLTVSFEAGFDAGLTGFTTSEIETATQEAWSRWISAIGDSYVPPGASIEVFIKIDPDNPDAVAGVETGHAFPTDYPIEGEIPSIQYELMTGEDYNGTEPDAVIKVGSHLGSTQATLADIMTHEFGHTLGFVDGFHIFDGTTSLFYDQIQNGYFMGPNAVATFGGPVPILQDGINQHLENVWWRTPTPVPSIMGDSSGLGYDTVNPVDIAVLKDIGVIGSALPGTASDDVTVGWYGPDTLVGGDGSDQLHGNFGRDVLYGNTGADFLAGNEENDSIFAGQGEDTALGGTGDDIIYGNKGDDLLYGENGDDALYGGQDADVIYGNDGNDRLDGNLGFDTLHGGEGADTFVISVDADVASDFTVGTDKVLTSGSFATTAQSISGSDLIVTSASGDSITLVGVSRTLEESSFLFL